MILWFFGAFFLSSVFLAVAFAYLAWSYRRPPSIYNGPLVLSLFLDLQAFAFAWAVGLRVVDIWYGKGLAPVLWDQLMIAYTLLFAAKSGLVWVAALKKERQYNKLIWWGYWGVLVVWSAAAYYLTL